MLHLLCTILSDDLGTLYRIALTSRFLSTIALPVLYSSLTEFPSDIDDEDRLAQDATSVKKWSSLWRSLAFSVLKPNSTAANYAASIKVLNLRDLYSLMEEFRSWRGQETRTAFFSGGLEHCNKSRKVTIGRVQEIFDVNLSTDLLTDIIVAGTRVCTVLIRQTIEMANQDPGHLHRWLSHMPALQALQVFSGQGLEDERVRTAIQLCPNLKSVEMYHWPEAAGSDFAAFLSSITGPGLERLVIKKASFFEQLSLSALSHFHGATLTDLELLETEASFVNALGIGTSITNLRSCSIKPQRGVILDEETLIRRVADFFTRNTKLEKLSLRIEFAEPFLSQVLPSLHLKSLTLFDLFDARDLCSAIPSQSNSLEEFQLDSTTEAALALDIFSEPEVFLDAICSLPKLKRLRINYSFLIGDWEIERIVNNCPQLTDLYVASLALSNMGLRALCRLSDLTTFSN